MQYTYVCNSKIIEKKYYTIKVIMKNYDLFRALAWATFCPWSMVYNRWTIYRHFYSYYHY